MEQVTFDTNSIQYVFAYFVPAEANREENVDRWRIPRHRFQLTNTSGTDTLGQYITSNWWSRTRPVGEKREYLIIGVRGHFNYPNIIGLVNGALGSRGNNRLTELERMQGIVIKEHFVIPGGNTRALAETNRTEDCFNVALDND